MFKKDQLRFGILLGFIAPLVGLLIYYFAQFRNVTSIPGFFYYVVTEKALLTAVISVLLVANAGVFTWYVNRRKDRTAKGVFISTCIYGIAALIWKFVS
jgi:predicted membrane-bound mannosyltransferase